MTQSRRFLKFSLSALLFLFVLTACSATTPANKNTATSLAPPPAPIVEGKAVPVVPHPNQRALLNNADPKLAANKKLVFDYWRTILNAGQVENIDKFIARDYKEYSLAMLNGREGFKQYINSKVSRKENIPELIEDPVVSIVAEGDLVAVVTVSHYFEPDGSGNTYTSSYFDLFRIQDNKIAAHWDSAQIKKGYVPLSVDRGGPLPVKGIVGLAQLELLPNADPKLANNKRLAFDLWRQTAEGGREELAFLYLDPIYIQHNPNAATGRDGFIQYMSRRPDSNIESHYEAPLIAIISEGDLVVQAIQGYRPDPNNPGTDLDIAWFDMFRIKDGFIIEHWDTASKGEVPKDQLKD